MVQSLERLKKKKGLINSTLLLFETIIFSGVVVIFAGCAQQMLMPPPKTESLLFFDGVCNLCDFFVNFVADHDSGRKIKFGAQQKHLEFLEKHNAPTDLSTVILIQNENVYLYSDAAIRTLALLDSPWNFLSVKLEYQTKYIFLVTNTHIHTLTHTYTYTHKR